MDGNSEAGRLVTVTMDASDREVLIVFLEFNRYTICIGHVL